MAKRKRLSLKSVQRKKKRKRKRKKMHSVKTLFNAFRVYKDREFPLTPQEVTECVRAALKCAKSSAWGASKISLKKPRVLWNTKMRTYNGRAFSYCKGRKKIGEIHLSASKNHLSRSKSEHLRTLRHEVAHIVQFRIGNRMGHRQDFKLIEQKLHSAADTMLILE